MTMATVANYAGQGHITGGIPMSNSGYVDKKKRAKLPPGWQPYSFVFRGEGFPVDENGEPLPLFDKYHNPNGPLNYYSYSRSWPISQRHWPDSRCHSIWYAGQKRSRIPIFYFWRGFKCCWLF